MTGLQEDWSDENGSLRLELMMDDKFIAEMAAFSDFVKASCKFG